LSFFDELKRRNVFRVGIAYGVAAWVLLQVADLVLENINAPEWVIQAMMLMVGLGFIAALVIAWAYEMTPEGIKKEADVDRSQSVTADTGRKMDRIIIGFLVFAVAILLYRQSGDDSAEPVSQPTAKPAETVLDSTSEAPGTSTPASESSESSDPRQSIAVLPFVNMSDDAQNEYFSDGISEELLNVLVKIESLRVPSRTSSFNFKDSDKSVSEIGEELQVDHVLEGSVRKAGDRIRVTAQLIDVKTDTHLWSDTYTRELDDIFAVQDEISAAIVAALQVTLSGTDQQVLADRSTDNVEAYNKFLLGRHLWRNRSTQSLLDSIVPLREAVTMDPGFGRAWAALADAYVLIPEYQGGAIDEFIPLAREATQRALKINPKSARALTTRAYYMAFYDFDFPNSLANYERAIEIDPSYPTAHQWYAETLSILRRRDEAKEEIRIAIELDPLAPILHHVMGVIESDSGNLLGAIPHYETALQLNPNRLWARKREELGDRDISVELAVIDAVENPALRDNAIKLILDSPDHVNRVNGMAFYFMLMGDVELAIQTLENGLEKGHPYSILANTDSLYDSLRDNPRFQAHLKKMNLWP
jgi:TolB-like protein